MKKIILGVTTELKPVQSAFRSGILSLPCFCGTIPYVRNCSVIQTYYHSKPFDVTHAEKGVTTLKVWILFT